MMRALLVVVSDLENSLILMGEGMLGIFVVMAAISLIVYAFTKVGGKKAK